MDKEVCDRGYRIVGQFEAFDAVAKSIQCMPNDRTTAALLESIRMLTNKATLSAWEYADNLSREDNARD